MYSSNRFRRANLFNELLAWNKRAFVTWWLWIPLIFASYAFIDREDRRTDMYEVARTTPRFVREGVVDDIGIRGRWMQLKTSEGTRRISCEAAAPRSRDTDCLPRKRFPLRIEVTLVDYQGIWLIISANDKTSVILSADKQLSYLKRRSDFSRTRTPHRVFIENFVMAFVLGGGLALLARRRRRKLLEASTNVR